MCRIAGIVDKSLPSVEKQRLVALMCNALAHGGPDDEGINIEGTVVFGHRRLAIIDLTNNGHQPMTDVQERIWITFNGEIYNYAVLRQELLNAGAIFRSQTDTEVIIQAYLAWGTDAFSKFRGMFAFALHDISNGLVYLVRDTMGVKPLYYHVKNGALCFASELRAFKAAGIENTADHTWRIKFLAFGHIPEPQTTLKNVLSLPKGTFLCWKVSSSTHLLKSYVKPVKRTLITNVNAAHAAVKDALTAAIKRQLIADAPIGVFLSGGIDSSLLTLLASAQKHQQLNTVSIFFNEESYDEYAFQKIISAGIEGKKHSHLVTQKQFNEGLTGFIAAMDMPTMDGVNSWFISKYAHQDGLKAVLSGLGADELFGGYPSFNRIGYLQKLQKAPPALLKAIAPFFDDRYKKLAYLSRPEQLALYLSMRALFAPPDIAALLNCTENEVYNAIFDNQTYNQCDSCSSFELASKLESDIYMQNQLLRDTDVMSMSHGLEVRVPFLDEDLHAVVQSIQPQLRFNKKQPKKLLIDSFTDILPKAVWSRPKMGFSFPLQKWMSQHTAITDEQFYNGTHTRNVIKGFKKGQLHWSKAFVLYLMQLNA